MLPDSIHLAIDRPPAVVSESLTAASVTSVCFRLTVFGLSGRTGGAEWSGRWPIRIVKIPGSLTEE